jgi:hypothetical protein
MSTSYTQEKAQYVIQTDLRCSVGKETRKGDIRVKEKEIRYEGRREEERNKKGKEK